MIPAIDYNLKYKNYVGIDWGEVGRGNLAGEMFFCGVKLKEGGNIDFVDDSKKTTLVQRESMFDKILENVEYHVVVKTAKEIDEKGLPQCIKECLDEIIQHFPNEKYVYDGDKKFNCTEPNLETLVKGDTKVKLIGAASIIAKVFKDRKMLEHSIRFPEYGFETNSGYGTPEHIQAIIEYGYTEIHRKSFKIKALEEQRSRGLTNVLF